MNAHRAAIVLGVVLMVMHFSAIRGAADGLPSVRVVAAEASVFERADVRSDVIRIVHAGAVLDLVDKGDGWYWILLARDQNGARKPGWIQTSHVAIATAPTSRDSLRTLHEELGALPATVEPRRSDNRKGKQEEARKAAEATRAQARIEQAARKVEAARRQYEELTEQAEEAPVR